MSKNIVYLNDDNFDNQVLKSSQPVLVDFWAEWCGPCKTISPILDEIADIYQNKLIIAKLNIDQNPYTAPKYSIRSIPTLLLFKQGKVVATKIGTLTKNQLEEFVLLHLS